MVTALDINRHLSKVNAETRNGYLDKFLIEMNPIVSSNGRSKPRRDTSFVKYEVEKRRSLLKDLRL
ncbi:MAG: hypothetical protein ACE5HY_02410 [Candidatus Hydrothermarchaeales archaeon]